MAWTGVPVVTSLGKNVVRVSGMTLANGATASIGIAGSGADTILPAGFPTAPDAAAVALGLSMTDLVEITYTSGNAGGADANHMHVDLQATPFKATFGNDVANPTGVLSIFFKYLHSVIR